MNSYFRHFVTLLVVIAAFIIVPKQTFAQQEPVNFQVFYDELSPYGQWVDYENYGYVWIPDVGGDFVPYSTQGYWQFTDYGWTWVSDYEWGWAPFHYGRWGYDNYYGWLWVPGNEWGPSWVNWRRADGYYGWSPMEPGITLNLSFGRQYDRNRDHWMFVRDRDFDRHDLNHYSVNRSENARIISNSSMINTTFIDNRHTTYVAGPAREDVQRAVGRTINPIAVQDNNKPGKDLNNGQLRIFRPQVEKNNSNRVNPAPGRISNLKEVKKPVERKGIIQPRSTGSQSDNPVQPAPTRSVTPENSNGVQPALKSPQQNSRINASPAQQQRTVAPVNTNVRQQSAAPVRPQNNSQNSQPAQRQRTVAPVNTNVRQQPAAPVRPQNNSQNSQPAQQQRTVTPAKSNVRQQPAAARPRNNINRVQQPNSVKPQNRNENVQPKESRPERDK